MFKIRFDCRIIEFLLKLIDLKGLFYLFLLEFVYNFYCFHFIKHFEESLFYCFEQKLSERVFNEAAQKAWKKFFWKMVGKLCEGIYLAEIDEFHKTSQAKKSASFKNF